MNLFILSKNISFRQAYCENADRNFFCYFCIKNNMETCNICQKNFNNLKGLSTHFYTSHNLKNKQYYDSFLLKDGNNLCVVCNKITTFRNLGVGYLKHCSMKCRNLDKNIKKDFWKGKKQSKETIEKRIKNINQIEKEKNKKKTLLEKYGYDNSAKIPSVKLKLSNLLKGRKFTRNENWQNNIIKSKIKNNTLKHSDKTKDKISKSLLKYYENNSITKISINKNHLSGWYKNVFFRSSLELSFLINNPNKIFESCENKKYSIRYKLNDKYKTYYPDYTDGHFIYEIKPSGLVEHNKIKLDAAKNIYGDRFILITEKESPYVTKNIIQHLIKNGEIILISNSEKIFKRYKH